MLQCAQIDTSVITYSKKISNKSKNKNKNKSKDRHGNNNKSEISMKGAQQEKRAHATCSGDSNTRNAFNNIISGYKVNVQDSKALEIL